MRKLKIYFICLNLSLGGLVFGNQNDSESTNGQDTSFKKNNYKEKALNLIKENDKDALLTYLDNEEVKNDSEIQALIGCLHYEGRMLENDEKLAIDWWKKAALQGNEFAQNILDEVDFTEEKLKDALQKAAQNHLPSLEGLAFRYYCGAGVEKNEKKAFEFYEKAASLGSLSAQCELANMCFLGQGTEKNLKKAFLWWEKAANAGCAKSQMELAVMYMNGEYVERSIEMAKKYFELSANQGLDEAQYKLAMLYKMCGKETSAREWIKKSAAQGNEKAKIELESIKKKDAPYGCERSGEYLNPGHIIYSFSSGKMQCQSEIVPEGHIFVELKNLDENTEVKFSKVKHDQEENSILVELFMSVKEDTQICKSWTNQSQINIKMCPNPVKKTSLKGTSVYKNEKFTVLSNEEINSEILFSSDSAEKVEKVSNSTPKLQFKVSKMKIDWKNNYDEQASKYKKDYSATFTAENFPKDVPVILTIENLSGKINQICELYVDQNNDLCPYTFQKPYMMVFQNVLEGEPFECTLKTEDGEFSTKITLIPNPMEKKDENGHVLSLCMRSPSIDMFELNASGFEPNEKVEFLSESGEEKIRKDLLASENGKIFLFISPAVKGKTNGNASVEIRGKSTQNLKLKYKWGYKSRSN